MHFAGSFFLALFVASAIPALAADKQSSPPPLAVPAQSPGALTRGPYARQFLARAGLLSKQEETRVDLGRPFVPQSTLLYVDPRQFQVNIDPHQLHALLLEDQDGRLRVPAAQAAAQMANDGLCYTMRMYKVKPTERLAGEETARRGYSTCELASNYQVRSAVAHERTVEAVEAPEVQTQLKFK